MPVWGGGAKTKIVGKQVSVRMTGMQARYLKRTTVLSPQCYYRELLQGRGGSRLQKPSDTSWAPNFFLQLPEPAWTPTLAICDLSSQHRNYSSVYLPYKLEVDVCLKPREKPRFITNLSIILTVFVWIKELITVTGSDTDGRLFNDLITQLYSAHSRRNSSY